MGSSLLNLSKAIKEIGFRSLGVKINLKELFPIRYFDTHIPHIYKSNQAVMVSNLLIFIFGDIKRF